MTESAIASRRGFLKLGFWSGTAALSLLAIQTLGPMPGRYEQLLGDERPRVLSRKQFAVLALFALDIVGAPSGRLSPQQTRTAARVDLELAITGGKLASDVRAALAVLEHGPLMQGEFSRYTSMPHAARRVYLSGLQHAENPLLRSVYSGLRLLVLFFYYSDERSWPRVGYGGPWVPEKPFEGGNRIVNLERRA